MENRYSSIAPALGYAWLQQQIYDQTNSLERARILLEQRQRNESLQAFLSHQQRSNYLDQDFSSRPLTGNSYGSSNSGVLGGLTTFEEHPGKQTNYAPETYKKQDLPPKSQLQSIYCQMEDMELPFNRPRQEQTKNAYPHLNSNFEMRPLIGLGISNSSSMNSFAGEECMSYQPDQRSNSESLLSPNLNELMGEEIEPLNYYPSAIPSGGHPFSAGPQDQNAIKAGYGFEQEENSPFQTLYHDTIPDLNAVQQMNAEMMPSQPGRASGGLVAHIPPGLTGENRVLTKESMILLASLLIDSSSQTSTKTV